MNRRSLFPLWLWAIRDNARRPGEAMLFGVAIAVLVALTATPLLLSAGLETTVLDALARSPSLVVRRIGPGGWMPVPVDPSIRAARNVPGVIDARPRIWGTVSGPDGPLTMVAWTEQSRPDFLAAGLSTLPRPGEAVAGQAIGKDGTITLATQPPAPLRIVGRFPGRTGLITHDTLLVHPDDARRMLGLGAGLASDLAVEVFFPDEQAAILPDLAQAFPWPVRIVTREEATGRYKAELARRGGIAMVTLVPAVAALVLLVTATVREHLGKRVEIGLYKAMGWTTPDLAWFMGLRAAMVGLPAAALGAGAAYTLVFWPGITWPVRLFFGWQQAPPGLTLNPAGAGMLLAAVVAMVLLPFFLAVLWPTLAAAAAPPGRFLEERASDA
jgi:FtsX-like permease family